MHLVLATSIVPTGTATTGYEIANAAIVDALRRAGVKVTVLGFIWPGAAPADPEHTVVLGEVDVRTDNASGLQKASWLLKAVSMGLTFSSVKLRAATPEQVRAALSSIEPYDGYILNAAQFAGAFEEVFRDRPSIFVAHNVEYRSAEENAAAARGLMQKVLYAREAGLLRGIERRLCDRAAFVWTLADDDRPLLGVDGDDRSSSLPLVTRLHPPQPGGSRATGCDAALIGTWTWQPNRIGLEWFLDEVVPHLPPEFTVRIAGKTPSDLASSHPGVEFVGFVPDATDFVRSARVIPLASRAGTGVQLKTIETFELGLPSVATTRSLRGIANVPDNCVVADDPADFARALVEAARNPKTDADGRLFYAAQRAALDREIARGLAHLGKGTRHEAAA
ncbi:MAG: glycosyltransferase family 4 protein [Mesorhizobium sp.]|nr:glycosyltransferase [Mesorhizobium sp.]MCO5160406.1 glycosyltransferase family 4 protein [Mesorhizobium sp.]